MIVLDSISARTKRTNSQSRNSSSSWSSSMPIWFLS